MDTCPIRILLIDDDEDDFLEARALLDDIPGLAFVLDWVKTYEAGLEALARREHDVYLLDYRLDGRTGLELLRQGAHGPAPIILLTAQGDREVDLQAMEAGAADYLIKGRTGPQDLERSIRYARERQRAAAALRQAHDDLEKRVAERTAELSAANALLAETDRRKDEFLAMLAHELRNPLAPAAAAVEFMRQRGLGHPDLEAACAVVERQVQHLARLVDDLLDVARIMRGKIQLRPEPVKLSTVLARAIETSKPLVEARRHQLHVAVPLEPLDLEADPTRLSQVFGNLLNNAAKFTEEGGQVWLHAERLDEPGQPPAALVRVRDTGIGIAPEVVPRVFDLFAQADSSLDRSSGGLGIGLTLVRRLVELHGGSVTAASPGLGQGSEFIVRLPLARTRSRATHRQTPGAAQLPRRRVLLVDDNVDTVEMLAQLLAMDGQDVRTAHDGASALAVAADFQPDVILMDIGLPGMNGYEVASRMRKQEALDKVLLVALTGYDQEEDHRRSKEAGFDFHLIKPVTLKVLQTLLGDPAKIAENLPKRSPW
jgi:signal transduction histidine kinase